MARLARIILAVAGVGAFLAGLFIGNTVLTAGGLVLVIVYWMGGIRG